MIVSASYKTDIPAFYGDWFTRRLAAGFCRTVNPYGRQVSKIPLTPDAVDGFVFWTRNLGPFQAALGQVRDLGIPFCVQYTVTGYPRALDAATIDPAQAVGHLCDLARTDGPRAGVWRYDPILLTSLTPPDWHRATFAGLARSLEGVVDEVIVSVAQQYRKTARNLAAAARAFDFTWHDPPAEESQALLADLAEIAAGHGMRLTLCGQPELLIPGIAEASCIEARRLGDIAGHPVRAQHKPHRASCACDASRDIGEYDTCPHGCVYCYAVQNRSLAKHRFKEHDPAGEFLFPPPPNISKSKRSFGGEQGSLF